MKIRCIKVGGSDPFYENFTKGKVYECTDTEIGFYVTDDSGLELMGNTDVSGFPFVHYFHSEFRVVE